jgi:hydroxymethylpyrimidine/phosphomethylpyrimidine kinase
MSTPVALTIAGSDPSGGAGIQADLKTFHQFGVYGEAVITLITVQNSRGVECVRVLDPELVAAQIRAVVEDIRPRAAKIGAIGNRDVALAVADLAGGFDFPLVVDPVLLSKNGIGLADLDAISPLFRHAFLLTPNLDEASALCGFRVDDLDSMRRAGTYLVQQSASNVLVKGGHLSGDAVDVLENGGELREFRGPRIETPHTHGTGCAYSAAITAELAKGTELIEAVARAKAWVTEAIRSNPGLGGGSGPLNFFAGI